VFENCLPSNQILQDMDTASKYLHYLFQAKLAVPDGAEAPSVAPPGGFRLSLIIEYEWIAEILSKAYRSPSKYYFYKPSVKIVMSLFQFLFHGVQGIMPRNCHPGQADILQQLRSILALCFRHCIRIHFLLWINPHALLIMRGWFWHGTSQRA
jgi:hypothetical protein